MRICPEDSSTCLLSPTSAIKSPAMFCNHGAHPDIICAKYSVRPQADQAE